MAQQGSSAVSPSVSDRGHAPRPCSVQMYDTQVTVTELLTVPLLLTEHGASALCTQPVPVPGLPLLLVYVWQDSQARNVRVLVPPSIRGGDHPRRHLW